VGTKITESSESEPSATTPERGMTSIGSAFDESCLFCRIVAGRVPAKVVRETEDFLSFRDIGPQAPTHVLVIPKVHGYRDAGELAAKNPQLAGRLLAEGAEVARLEGLTEHADIPGYRFVLNSGDAAGQTVYHVHLHVLGGEALGHFGSAEH
jgi:histidine triad (HIT) family protein